MTIRWGIIGCGAVCELKSGPPLYKLNGSELRVVMRRSAALAEDYARRHAGVRFTTEAQAVIDDPEVDAVYIATPPGSHAMYALSVAVAKKPCYVEKPMARSAPECRRMLAAFESVGQPLFVAYYRRALPRFLKLKELIESGCVGRVVAISYSMKKPFRELPSTAELPWRLDAARSGGGLFVDLGSHVLDLLLFLFGPFARVTGSAKNHARVALVEDTVVGTLVFESGVVGNLSFCFAAGSFADSLEVVGDEGQISCSVFGQEPLELCNQDGTESIYSEHPSHVQGPLIASIVDELSGKSVRCPSRGENAVMVSAAIDQLLGAYYGGRDDEFWERPATWPGLRTSAR